MVVLIDGKFTELFYYRGNTLINIIILWVACHNFDIRNLVADGTPAASGMNYTYLRFVFEWMPCVLMYSKIVH
jgi:hypothetical protein